MKAYSIIRALFYTSIMGYSFLAYPDYFPFKEIEADFDAMEKSFRSMHEKIYAQTAQADSWTVDYKDQEKHKALVITIGNVITKNIVPPQLSADHKRLKIVTDNGTMNVKVAKDWLSLHIEQTFFYEKKSKKRNSQTASTKSWSSSRSVSHMLELEQAKIDYNAADQKLTITIPYIQEIKKGKTIPVNMQ